MRLKVFVSPEMGENCYFVIDENTKEAIVIDPGDMDEKLCSIVDKEGLDIKAICLTHAHFDHAGQQKNSENIQVHLFLSAKVKRQLQTLLITIFQVCLGSRLLCLMTEF